MDALPCRLCGRDPIVAPQKNHEALVKCANWGFRGGNIGCPEGEKFKTLSEWNKPAAHPLRLKAEMEKQS